MGSDDEVHIMQSIDGGNTWTSIYSWTSSNQPDETGQIDYIDISSVTSSNTKFAVFATEGSVDDIENYNFYIDDFEVRAIPSCTENTNFTVVQVGSDTAQLSWTSPSSAAQWQIEYGENGFTQGNGLTALFTETNVTLENLVFNSDYQVYVRAICSVGDTSGWTGPVSFSTICGLVTPNYSQEFNSSISNTCWIESEGPISGPDLSDDTSDWAIGNYLNSSAQGKSAKVNLFNTSHKEWLISPEFNLSAGGYEINLDAAVTKYSGTNLISMGSDDSVCVMQTLDGGSTWTTIHTWTSANQPTNLGNNYTFNISGITNANVQFAIFASDGSTDDSEDYYFYIENFKVRTVPTCLENTDLELTSRSSTFVGLTWTSLSDATTWEIEYGVDGFIQGNGTVEVATDTNYTIEGLQTSTDYQAYVRAVCGTGNGSEWLGPIDFTTLCEAITPNYTEDFTTYLDPCWAESEGPISGPNFSDETSTWDDGNFLNNSSLGKGVKLNLFNTSHDEWLLSPVFDLSAGGYQIKLNVGVTNYNNSSIDVMGSDDTVRVMQTLDGGATWTVLHHWSLTNQPSHLGDIEYIDLSGLTHASVQFAIYATDGPVDDSEDYDFHIDNFTVRTIPSCLENTNLSVVEVGSDTAQIKWTSLGTTTQWLVEYGLNGFTLGNGTSVMFTDTVATLENLIYNSDYQAYVRSVCSVGDSSDWIGPVSFSTICGVITPDYIQEFNSNISETCWSESEGPISGPDLSDDNSQWFVGNYLNDSSLGKAAKINLFTTNRDEWLLSPEFDLSSGGYELSLDVGVTNYNTAGVDAMGSDDSVRVMQSVDGGSTWTMIYSWSLVNQPSHLGEHVSIDISGLSSANVQFALFATDGPVDDSEDYDFFVDNFSIEHNPCLTGSSQTDNLYTGCQGDGYSIIVGTSVYNESYTSGVDTLSNSLGCDSIVTTQLTFNPVYEVNNEYTGCEGDGYSITVGTSVYNETNLTGIDTLSTINGCDSIVTTELVFKSETSFILMDTTCSGELEFNEQTYTSTGVYTQTLTNAMGCDSTLTLDLVINTPTSETIIETSCLGTLTYNGEEYTSTGVYTQTLTNSNGCDSVLTLDLIIDTPDTVTFTQATCSDTLTINGEVFTETGEYEQVLSNVNGCDSVVNLNLEFGTGTFGAITQLVCEDSVVINSVVYTSTGVYTQTIPVSAICDSTLEINLTFAVPTTQEIVDTTCSGSFEFNGETFTTTGIYTQMLTNTNGCDSTLTLDLVINTPSSETIVDSTCSGILTFNGVDYTSTGIYSQTLTNTVGCDSVLTLDLVINEETAETIVEETCTGLLTYNGVDYTSTGVYTQTLMNAAGCDSVLTLDLEFNLPTSYTINDTTCAGILTFNGQDYTESGIYTQTLTNAVGCDSTLTLELVINEHTTETITETTCLGVLEYNGVTYTTSGVYTQDLTSVAGCDSTLTLDLTIGEVTTGTYTESTCVSELEINGVEYTSTGVYTQTLTNSMDCDSIVTLNLTFLESTTGVYNETTCEDELTVNAMVYTTSGTYTQTLTNAAGCDSIITLNLVMDLTSPETNDFQLICSEEVDINGIVYTSTGVYQQTFTNVNGCDSLVNYHLDFSVGDSIFIDTVVCGQNSFEYEDFIMYNTGEYEFSQEQTSGCPTIITVDVEFVEEFEVEITQVGKTLVCNQTTGTYQWYDCNTGIPGVGETDSIFNPQINGEYYVEVTINGCTYQSECFTTYGIGIDEVEEGEFVLYPNPNNGTFSIQMSALGTYQSYRITTTLGQVVTEKSINSDELEIEIQANLAPGVYYIQLLTQELKWESKALIVE